MSNDVYDVSDEATGLTPMHDIDPQDSMLALKWLVGPEGLVTLDEEQGPIAVKYASFRGIIHDEEGQAQYAQLHVALPHHAVRAFLEQWLAVLDETEDTPPASP